MNKKFMLPSGAILEQEVAFEARQVLNQHSRRAQMEELTAIPLPESNWKDVEEEYFRTVSKDPAIKLIQKKISFETVFSAWKEAANKCEEIWYLFHNTRRGIVFYYDGRAYGGYGKGETIQLSSTHATLGDIRNLNKSGPVAYRFGTDELVIDDVRMANQKIVFDLKKAS